MAKQTIGVGTTANDGTGDTLRASFQKVNANDNELYARTFKAYKSGNWYIGDSASVLMGTCPSNSIRLVPFFIRDTVTVDSLGTVIGTAESGKSLQFAIYASDATGKVTGNPLATTGSISMTSSGAVNGTVNSGTPVQLTAGMYWFGRNTDSVGTGTTANLSPGVNTYGTIGAIVGSATQVNLISTTGTSLTGFISNQTFGTWPDLTAVTPSETNGSSGGPLPMYHLSSVP